MMQAPAIDWSMLVPLKDIETFAPAAPGVYQIWKRTDQGDQYQTRGSSGDLRKRLNEHRLEAQRLGVPGLFARWKQVPQGWKTVEKSIPKGSGDTYEMELEMTTGGHESVPASGRWTRRSPGVIVIHLRRPGYGPPR